MSLENFKEQLKKEKRIKIEEISGNKNEIKDWIRELEREGFAGEFKGALWLVQPGLSEFVKGVVKVNRKGKYCVESASGLEYDLGGFESRGVLLDDEVKAFAVLKKNKMGWDANPVYVYKRDEQKPHYGIVVKRKDTSAIVLDGRMQSIAWDPQDFKLGDLVVLKFKKNGLLGKNSILSREKFGNLSDPGIESNWVIKKYWPDLKQSKESELKLNTVLTDSTDWITIDAKNSKDLDDAIWAKKTETGYTVKVAIANVSSVVPIGSIDDENAKNQMTSIYLPHKVIPMFRESISNELCSLNEGVNRSALVLNLKLSKVGEVISYEFKEEGIRVKKRANYIDVDRYLKGEKVEDYEDISEILNDLNEISGILKDRGIKEGRYDLGGDGDVEYMLDESGKIHKIINRDFGHAQCIVEELMLLANEMAAKHIDKVYGYGTFRNHPGLKELGFEKIQEIAKKLKLTDPSNDNSILTWVGNEKKGNKVSSLRSVILGNMNGASYEVKNKGHFSLAKKHYMHFTSPIRRYMDLVVHRMLIAAIRNDTAPYTIEDLESLVIRANEKNKLASKSESESKKMLLLELLQRESILSATVISLSENNVWLKVNIAGGSVELPLGLSVLKGAGLIWNEVEHRWENGRGEFFEKDEKLTVRINDLGWSTKTVDLKIEESRLIESINPELNQNLMKVRG